MNTNNQLQTALIAVRAEMARLSKAMETEKDPIAHAALAAEVKELTLSLGLSLETPVMGDGPAVTEHTIKTETVKETITQTESAGRGVKEGVFIRMKNWIKRHPWWTAAIVTAVGATVYVAFRVKVVSPAVVQGLFKKSTEVVADAAPTLIEVPAAEPGAIMTVLNKAGAVLSKAGRAVGDTAVAAKDAVVGFFQSAPAAEVATATVEVPADATVLVMSHA